jgi:hypothetical protein
MIHKHGSLDFRTNIFYALDGGLSGVVGFGVVSVGMA